MTAREVLAPCPGSTSVLRQPAQAPQWASSGPTPQKSNSEDYLEFLWPGSTHQSFASKPQLPGQSLPFPDEVAPLGSSVDQVLESRLVEVLELTPDSVPQKSLASAGGAKVVVG